MISRATMTVCNTIFAANARDGVPAHGMKNNLIKEHDRVVLKTALPAEKLEAGDVGTIVHIHAGGAGCEVEFVTLAGKTIAVATVEAAQVRPVGKRDVNHVRELQPA